LKLQEKYLYLSYKQYLINDSVWRKAINKWQSTSPTLMNSWFRRGENESDIITLSR